MTSTALTVQNRRGDRADDDSRRGGETIKWRPNNEVPARRREDDDQRDRDEEKERQDRRGS